RRPRARSRRAAGVHGRSPRSARWRRRRVPRSRAARRLSSGTTPRLPSVRRRGRSATMVLRFRTTAHKQCLEITDEVRAVVRDADVAHGLCHVTVLHATAAIVVNENDDPNIGVDLLTALDRAIPDHAGWLHDRIDGNAQAHIKAAILGPSETLPIHDGD